MTLASFAPPSGFFIGSFFIGFYGLVIACSATLAYFIARKFAKYRNIDSDNIYIITVFTIPIAIIGARFLHVILNWNDYTLYQAIAFWDGFAGLAIFGGLIFGAASIAIVCYFKKINIIKMLDVATPVFLLAQGLGRWGNFFNQELYGNPVNFDFFPFSVFIERTGNNHLSLFFIEFLANVVGFFVLWFILKKYNHTGIVAASYAIWYGTTRFILEPLRMSQFHPQTGVNVFSIISALLIILGVAYFVYTFVVQPKLAAKKRE